MVQIGGIGAKMLAKMGWTEGTGLGRNRDGVVDALVHKRRPQALGIGAEKRPFQDAWWEKMLESAYGTPAKKVDDEALFKASDGRRCRPHGTAKLARLEAHDKSTFGEKESEGPRKLSKSEKKLLREQKKEGKAKKRRKELKLLEKGITKRRKKSRRDREGTEDNIR